VGKSRMPHYRSFGAPVRRVLLCLFGGDFFKARDTEMKKYSAHICPKCVKDS
jgi:hypothetical protein